MSQVWNLSSSTFVLWSLYFKHSLCMRQQICFVLSWNEIWIFSKYVCCTSYDTKLYLYTLYFLHKIWICEASFRFPWQWTQNNRMWSLNLLFKSLSFHYRLHKFMLREIKTTHAVVNGCSVGLFLGWWIRFPVLSSIKHRYFLFYQIHWFVTVRI